MSFQGLPAYFVGRHLRNARITPLTMSLGGIFTRGASQDIANLSGPYLTFDDCVFDESLDDEEISPANVTQRNHVPLKDDFEVTLRELKYPDPSGNALLWFGWIGIDHFLVEVALIPYGLSNSLPYTVQAVCMRKRLSDPYGEGKSDFELHGVSCGLPIAYIASGQSLVYV